MEHMNGTKKTLAALTLLICSLSLFSASTPDKPAIADRDRIRLAEAFRIAERPGEDLWKNWNAAPFAVLLVTSEYEFLIRHDRPSPDFEPLGRDELFDSDVWFRKRTMNQDLLATFPAVGGVPTIVIGQAENTAAQTSTPWVLTLLHEHFHQLQMSHPDYYASVDSLDLSGGDQSGMWMLNFPFPYDSKVVQEKLSNSSRLLLDALQEKKTPGKYFVAREQWKSSMKDEDYRYLSFQLWQEGIARYTEYRMAVLASEKHVPSKSFAALSDYETFNQSADKILRRIKKELADFNLMKDGRVSFYTLGAAEGLLLDKMVPNWRDDYFVHKFFLEKYAHKVE